MDEIEPATEQTVQVVQVDEVDEEMLKVNVQTSSPEEQAAREVEFEVHDDESEDLDDEDHLQSEESSPKVNIDSHEEAIKKEDLIIQATKDVSLDDLLSEHKTEPTDTKVTP